MNTRQTETTIPRAKRRGQVQGQVGHYDGLADMLLSFALTSIVVFGALMFGWITVR